MSHHDLFLGNLVLEFIRSRPLIGSFRFLAAYDFRKCWLSMNHLFGILEDLTVPNSIRGGPLPLRWVNFLVLLKVAPLAILPGISLDFSLNPISERHVVH